MAPWPSRHLFWFALAAMPLACAEGPVQSKRGTNTVSPDRDDDNETMVEAIDPRCGTVAIGNGCVVHKIRATAEIFEALGKPITGPLYFAIYAEQKVEMTGPGDNTPDYSYDPTDVGLHNSSEVVEIVCGDITPGEYETLAFVDIDGVVDPDNRHGPSGAPSTVPGPTFTIVAGHTTTSDLTLQLLLP